MTSVASIQPSATVTSVTVPWKRRSMPENSLFPTSADASRAYRQSGDTSHTCHHTVKPSDASTGYHPDTLRHRYPESDKIMNMHKAEHGSLHMSETTYPSIQQLHEANKELTTSTSEPLSAESTFTFVSSDLPHGGAVVNIDGTFYVIMKIPDTFPSMPPASTAITCIPAPTATSQLPPTELSYWGTAGKLVAGFATQMAMRAAVPPALSLINGAASGAASLASSMAVPAMRALSTAVGHASSVVTSIGLPAMSAAATAASGLYVGI